MFEFGPWASADELLIVDDPTDPLGEVENLTAVQTGVEVVTVSWDAVATATHYEVERSIVGAGGPDTIVVQTTSVVDANDKFPVGGHVYAGNTYLYRVRARRGVE